MLLYYVLYALITNCHVLMYCLSLPLVSLFPRCSCRQCFTSHSPPMLCCAIHMFLSLTALHLPHLHLPYQWYSTTHHLHQQSHYLKHSIRHFPSVRQWIANMCLSSHHSVSCLLVVYNIQFIGPRVHNEKECATAL